jgi:hypothetical protein
MLKRKNFACTPPFLVHEDFEQFLARLPFYCMHAFQYVSNLLPPDGYAVQGQDRPGEGGAL